MHRGAGVIDRHRPVVAGYVPVELVIVTEKARSIAYAVGNLNRTRGVHGVGDVDFQVTGATGSCGIVLELAAVAIGDAGDADE